MIYRIFVLTLLLVCNRFAFADQPILTVKKIGGHIRYELTNPPFERTPAQKPLKQSDYSARIIDINDGRIEGTKTSCDDMIDYLRSMYAPIHEGHRFYYSIQLDCYPTQSGITFEHRSLINPTDEDAVKITEKFIKKWDGALFYGSKISFQKPKLMLFTMTASIGKTVPESDALTRHFFTIATNRYNNLFEVSNAESDLFYNFDPKNEQTLPVFLKLFPTDGQNVLAAIHQSNIIEIFGYPTIFYGEDLKEYETMVGTSWMFIPC